MNHLDIFEIPSAPGLKFRVHIEQDDTNEAPWERECGHGPVRTISEYRRCDTTQKKPGERVLHVERETKWLYDWQAATKLARKDGWDAPPYSGHEGRIERAVQADFDRLRRWLNSDWYYVGVCVEVIDEDGDAITGKYRNALWGIESDCEDYIEETAHELADQAAEKIKEFLADEQRIVYATAATAADAERWRKLCAIVKSKDLGTEVEPDGKLRSPMYRRWFFDCPDLSAETLQAALDSIKEQQA